jgi:Fur family peroxide stress response transcriptional regulator
MKTTRRKSLQREKIYSIIQKSSDHPTALQVSERVRKRLPSAAVGNVYRNIKILIEEGRIQSRDFGDGVEHYDAITDSHYHFICERCGKIHDFHMPVQHQLEKKAGSRSGLIITGHTIQFSGICLKCKSKMKGTKK